MYLLFFIADTICNIPYSALAPELSSNPREREKIYFCFYFFQYTGILFSVTAPVVLQYLYFNKCDLSQCNEGMDIESYTLCMNIQQQICNNKNNLNALRSVAIFISIFYVIGIFMVSYFIEEKYKKQNEEVSNKRHFIPLIYNMFKNQPFRKIIKPYILDNIVLSIFSAVIPFYAKYVINPEEYCVENGLRLNTILCNSNLMMGVLMTVFFVFSLIFIILWNYLVSIFGKKSCWRMYSLIGFVCFNLFIINDRSHPYLLFFSVAICALPSAGSYINDAIISDIIDYDEFLTDSRNEGVYTVFSTFVPKLVSIFSQTIPMIVLSSKFFLYSTWIYLISSL